MTSNRVHEWRLGPSGREPGARKGLLVPMAAFFLALVIGPLAALAQPFELAWSSIDAGGRGYASSASRYEASSTIGQADAFAAADVSGGGYRFEGGFWGGAPAGPPPTPTPTPVPTVTPTRTPAPRGDADGDGFDDNYEIFAGSDPNNPQSRPSLGDVNGDGLVNILDAVELSRGLQGLIPLTIVNDADLDGNGVIDQRDVDILYGWAIGKGEYAIIPLN